MNKKFKFGAEKTPVLPLDCLWFSKMSWLGAQHGFLVESYLVNSSSYYHSIKLFRKEFRIGTKKPVPTLKTLKRWVKRLRDDGKTLKRSPPGRTASTRTPENIEKVRMSVQHSPMRSARKQIENGSMSALKTMDAIWVTQFSSPNDFLLPYFYQFYVFAFLNKVLNVWHNHCG